MLTGKLNAEKEHNVDDHNVELWNNLVIHDDDEDVKTDYLQIELNKQLSGENFSASSKLLIVHTILKHKVFI